MKNIFEHNNAQEVIRRIEKLAPTSTGLWGRMNVSQMLAHCNVTYELVYENKHPKPNFFMGLILKVFVKQKVVNAKPFARNLRTAPIFLIKESKNFDVEKKRLTNYILKTAQLGASHFDGKKSHAFGKLNKDEWNNMFYKHLDHHLCQFGV